MIFKQSGWKMFLRKSIGFLFIIFILMCILLYLVGITYSIRGGEGLSALIFPTVMYLFFICIFAIFAASNFWMFPDIELNTEGITLSTLFHKKNIAWSEVESFTRKKHEIYIVLSKDGLFWNRFHGLLYARVWDKPIVFFTSDEDNLNKLENELNSYLIKTP